MARGIEDLSSGEFVDGEELPDFPELGAGAGDIVDAEIVCAE